MVEVVDLGVTRSSEMSVSTYQTMGHHKLEDHSLNFYHYETQTSCKYVTTMTYEPTTILRTSVHSNMKQNIYESVWAAEKCTWSGNEAKYQVHIPNSVNIYS